MKKFLTLMVAIVVVCALSITAMAAPVSIGYKTYFMGDLFANVSESASTSSEAGFWTAGDVYNITVADGKVTFTTSGAWGSFGSFADASITKGKVGWAYYIKNNGDATAILASGFNADDGKGYKLTNECSYTLVDMQGNKTENLVGVWCDSWGQGGIEIPAGFEGWVYIGFDQYVPNDGTGSEVPFDSENYGVAAASFAFYNISSITHGGEFYAYSSEVTDTADISVIAYAVAAITGLGALVVAKKR